MTISLQPAKNEIVCIVASRETVQQISGNINPHLVETELQQHKMVYLGCLFLVRTNHLNEKRVV